MPIWSHFSAYFSTFEKWFLNLISYNSKTTQPNLKIYTSKFKLDYHLSIKTGSLKSLFGLKKPTNVWYFFWTTRYKKSVYASFELCPNGNTGVFHINQTESPNDILQRLIKSSKLNLKETTSIMITSLKTSFSF